MVIVFVLRAVDHEFEPRLGQMKDYKIDICCFSSQHATLRGKKNRLVGLELAYCVPSGATCLPSDCCFNKLALYKSNEVRWSTTKRTSSSYRRVNRSHHDIAEKLHIWR
jgi:hypothetical protein